MERLCVNCKHFYMSAGCPDYSDVTPGYSWEMACMKGMWNFDSYGDQEDKFCTIMSSAAQDCPLYEGREK